METFEAPLLDTEIRSGQFGTFLAQIKTKQNKQKLVSNQCVALEKSALIVLKLGLR